MIFELVKDFADALAAMPAEHPKRRMLELLQEAIRRDVHFIARHPTTLFQCMWNTCWWYDCPEAAAHYVEPEGGWPEPPPWEGAGSKLFCVMETWRTCKEAENAEYIWIRSLRPAPTHLYSPLKLVLNPAKGSVQCAAVSPDGSRIVTGSDNHLIQVWDARSGEEMFCLHGHADQVRSIACGPSGQRIVSGSDDKTVRVWDSTTGAQLLCLRHEAEVLTVAYAPHGERIATGTGYPYGSSPSGNKPVRIWDTESGAELVRFENNEDVRSVAFSPDGRLIAGASGSSVRIWVVETGSELHRFGRHDWMHAKAVLFSPDSQFLAGAGGTDSVLVWDVSTGEVLHHLWQQDGAFTSVAFSPDGHIVLCGGGDGIVVWDARTGKQLRHIKWTKTSCGLAIFPDGQHAITAGGEVLALASQCPDRPRSLVGHRELNGSVECLRVSPQGHTIATGGSRQDGTVRMWDADSGQQLWWQQGHRNRVVTLAFSPDGSRVASGSEDHAIRIWSVPSGALLHCLAEHESTVESLMFSPDGKCLASGSLDGTIRLWEVESGKPTRVFWVNRDGVGGVPPPEYVLSLAFSPNGRSIVCGAGDDTVRVWDIGSSMELYRLHGHHGWVDSVTFSPDGSRIISRSSIDRTVRVWDAETAACVEAYPCQEDTVAATAQASLVLWEARAKDRETVFKMTTSNCDGAWFPLSLSVIPLHPDLMAWVCIVSGDPHVLRLEGGRKP